MTRVAPGDYIQNLSSLDKISFSMGKKIDPLRVDINPGPGRFIN